MGMFQSKQRGCDIDARMGYIHQTQCKIMAVFKFFFRKKQDPTDLDRARSLVEAIDRGGIPLNAIRVNAIARSLGLEVSSSAPMPETIERIRAALERSASLGD